jgi:hypothetical protein
MVNRVIRQAVPVYQKPVKQPSLTDRMKEYAAQKAIGLGFNTLGSVGEKVIGNLFRKGGAAEMALTPQQTLDQRMQAAAAQNQMNRAKLANTMAQARRREAQAQQVPFDIDLKRAQAEKARMETRLAPVKEGRQRDRLDFDVMDAELDREHDQNMAFLNSKLDIILEGEKQKGRKELEKFKAKLRKSGKKTKSYVFADGTSMTPAEINRTMTLLHKQAQLKGDAASRQAAMNQFSDFVAKVTKGTPVAFTVTDDDTMSQGTALSVLNLTQSSVENLPRELQEELRGPKRVEAAQTLLGSGQPTQRKYTKTGALNVLKNKLKNAGVTRTDDPNYQKALDEVAAETGFKFGLK